MAKVYRIVNGGAELMDPVRCKDEGKELQVLLEKSPDLLAGEQIDPEVPRRWLLIKREMSVPDPVSASSRWSVDFLYVDQDATLTFVECKRHDDTRSRRDVIGQVFDYVANAPRLWTAEELRHAAQETQKQRGRTLESALAEMGGASGAIQDFFERAVANLRARKLRIILFLDDAPPELKTLVEFLNADLSNVEILLVEIHKFRSDGIEVVSPTLWGYTEEVRAQRRIMADALSSSRRKWDEKTFLDALTERQTDSTTRRAIERLHREPRSFGYQLTGGSGQVPSFNVRLPAVTDLALLTVTAEGGITANYASFAQKDQDAELSELRDRLASGLERLTHKQRPSNYPNCWPKFKGADWVPQVSELIQLLRELAQKSQTDGSSGAS